MSENPQDQLYLTLDYVSKNSSFTSATSASSLASASLSEACMAEQLPRLFAAAIKLLRCFGAKSLALRRAVAPCQKVSEVPVRSKVPNPELSQVASRTRPLASICSSLSRCICASWLILCSAFCR